MTSKMNTKVRLVRCPRCRLVLPELAEVPVYTCGGCGAVLQAKSSKNEIKDIASRIHEADPTQNHKLEHVSEDKEASSSNKKSTVLCTEEPDENSDPNESTDYMREQLGCINHDDEPRSSTELSSHENADSSPDTRARIRSDEEKYPLDQNNRRDQDKCGDSDLSLHESADSSPNCRAHSGSDEEKSPLGQYNRRDQAECGNSELSLHENSDSSPDTRPPIESEEEKSPLGQYNRRDQNECGDSELNLHENKSLSGQKDVDEHACSFEQENGSDRNEYGDSSRELPESVNCFKEKSSATELTYQEVEESSQVAGIDTKVNEIAEKLSDTRPSNEDILSNNEHVKQSDYGKALRFERISSVDTLENVPINNASSDLSVTLGDMPKSPTHRSYYAYDGSVSSFDGNDDQFTDLHSLPSRRNSVFSSKEFLKRDELRGPTRHGLPVRDMMRLETDKHRSRLPFYSRGSRVVHENASPSSFGLDEFRYSSIYHSPAKHNHPESEKLKLVRMVNELQNQLNRSKILMEKANGGLGARVAKKEKMISSCYDHLAADREMYCGLNYTRYPGRHGQEKSWSQQCKPPRTAFSGEAAYNRSQVDCSCFHCCPQEQYFSAQHPPHVICCNKGHYGTHPSHGPYSPYRSGPSSPQYHSGSKFSLFDDQWHRKDREVLKQHLRPIAGGAPLIACYQCSKLLQLPADFLLFNRRYHSLRCCACSKVLKFSLQNKSHIVPYIPETIAPPSSEVDDYANPIEENILVSASRASYGPHAEPVSCSDDYGRSFRKSYSTETDRFSLAAPFHALDKNSNDRKMSSGSSYEPVEDRKKSVMKDSEDRFNKKSVQTLDFAGPYSKMSKREKISSEIEEIPPTTGSPLHRLMGYASPSKVIRG